MPFFHKVQVRQPTIVLTKALVAGSTINGPKRKTPPPPPKKKIKKSQLGVGKRAPHPKNKYGHRDGLEPGMSLTVRDRHENHGPVSVLSGGRFRVGDTVYKGGHALLSALYSTTSHHMTMRRYFRLGGERAKTQVMQ